jgi:hypothetical protein
MGTRVLITLALVAGCETRSTKYCGLHPEDTFNCGFTDAGADAARSCAADPDCVAPDPRCDLDSHTCVQCLSGADCTRPEATICNLATHTCQGCIANSDCASQACLPTGTCGDDTSVAYVDPTAPAANTTCTFASQCSTIAKALATKMRFVKLHGTISEAVTLGKNVVVAFLADPGTTLTRPSNGAIFGMMAGDVVDVYDLELIGGAMTTVVAVGGMEVFRLHHVTIHDCGGPAIATNGGTFSLTRSRLYTNPGGALVLAGPTQFVVTNNFIYQNGTPALDQPAGGVAITVMTAGFNQFAFNTVADNHIKAMGADVGGVACTTVGLTLPDNLIVHNDRAGNAQDTAANTSVAAACDYSMSKIAIDPAPFAFVAPGDYHLTAASAAIDVAPSSPENTNVDIDNDHRPTGAGYDYGADEYKP